MTHEILFRRGKALHCWGDGRGGLAIQAHLHGIEGLPPTEVRKLRDACNDALEWASASTTTTRKG